MPLLKQNKTGLLLNKLSKPVFRLKKRPKKRKSAKNSKNKPGSPERNDLSKSEWQLKSLPQSVLLRSN